MNTEAVIYTQSYILKSLWQVHISYTTPHPVRSGKLS